MDRVRQAIQETRKSPSVMDVSIAGIEMDI